jgi:hypothetical protein
MLKKVPSFVLASLKASTYRKGTPRLFRSLRPRWMAFLNILQLSYWSVHRCRHQQEYADNVSYQAASQLSMSAARIRPRQPYRPVTVS